MCEVVSYKPFYNDFNLFITIKKRLAINCKSFSLNLNKKREKRSESSNSKEWEAKQSKWSKERKELSAATLIIGMHGVMMMMFMMHGVMMMMFMMHFRHKNIHFLSVMAVKNPLINATIF
jgi:hypothetical protein